MTKKGYLSLLLISIFLFFCTYIGEERKPYIGTVVDYTIYRSISYGEMYETYDYTYELNNGKHYKQENSLFKYSMGTNLLLNLTPSQVEGYNFELRLTRFILITLSILIFGYLGLKKFLFIK